MEKDGAGSGPRATMLAREYLALDAKDEQIHWKCLRPLMASVANVVVSPLQDILGLGSEARMNVPGRSHGNWSWRYRDDQLTVPVRKRLKTLTAIYGRSELLVEAIGREEEAQESYGGA